MKRTSFRDNAIGSKSAIKSMLYTRGYKQMYQAKGINFFNPE